MLSRNRCCESGRKNSETWRKFHPEPWDAPNQALNIKSVFKTVGNSGSIKAMANAC